MLTVNSLNEMEPYIEANINAGNIKALDVRFYAICCAYETLKCKTIRGRRPNAKYFGLDNEIKLIKE